MLFGYQDVMRFIGESASTYKKFRKLMGKSVSCWGLYNCMINALKGFIESVNGRKYLMITQRSNCEKCSLN